MPRPFSARDPLITQLLDVLGLSSLKAMNEVCLRIDFASGRVTAEVTACATDAAGAITLPPRETNRRFELVEVPRLRVYDYKAGAANFECVFVTDRQAAEVEAARLIELYGTPQRAAARGGAAGGCGSPLVSWNVRPPTVESRCADDDYISIRQRHSQREWTSRFGVTLEQLEEAVREVGPAAKAVEKYLHEKGYL